MKKYKTEIEQHICVLCGNPIDVQPNGHREGFKAEPAAKGNCCTHCHWTIVIPAKQPENSDPDGGDFEGSPI